MNSNPSTRLSFLSKARRWLAALSLAICAPTILAWTPGTGSPTAVQGFVVDPTNRTDVLSFYNCIYNASENYAANIAWTGSVTGCIPGTTSAAFKDDVRRRINFYRALSALPADITFDAVKSAKDQEAALMMSANNSLSHTPPNTWTCYTANGAQAAGASNIALGTYGPLSVDAFMRDSGGGNQIVGHRRWFHYSRASIMGTGDTPGETGFSRANCIWVIGDFKPAPAPQFVAWPNRGFVPFPLMPARWSLSYPGANFGAATVTMTVGGSAVSTAIISNVDTGIGDNTIVWEPAGLPANLVADTVCNVTVANISGAGVPATYSYSVTLFDPNVLGSTVTIAGSATPPTSGANYTFNSIAQSDGYELRVSTGSAATWVEGAEDAPVPQIAPHTTGSYALRQTAVKRTGAKAFQLAFPDFTDQSFDVTRDIVPSATSQLQWYDRGRFATTTTTLSAEVSTDSGATWTSVFSRPGVGLSSALWDAAFISRSVSLAAYAGQIVRVRFVLKQNGASIVVSTSANDGFFIDDITITNATELVGTTLTTLGGAATSFTLNAATAGAPLVAGTSYFLRMRPNVGCRWFGDGALKTVIAQTPSGYAGWVATQYPAANEGPLGDHEKDGILNGFEYAFGLNPLVPNAASAIPQPSRVGNTVTIGYTQSASLTDVTFGAQWSNDLVGWNTITDTGSGLTHTFTLNVSGMNKVFFRHRIVIAP
ncbi:MAG: hypothetical protein ABIZ56_04120 [Chthoniobacteraceae bacterium]